MFEFDFPEGTWGCCCSYFLEILGTMDLLSDVLVIVAMLDQEDDDRDFYYWYVDDYYGSGSTFPVPFKIGVVLFGLHLYISFLRDGFSVMKSTCGDNGSGYAFWIKLAMGYYVIPGVLARLEMFLRVLLVFIEPFVSLGFYSSTGEWNHVLLDRVFFFSNYQKQHFEGMNSFQKYFHCISCVMSGGRWQVKSILKQAFAKQNEEAEVNFCKKVLGFVALEESIENLGGVLLAAGLAMARDDAGAVLAFSFGTSIISALVETGKYLGDIEKAGKFDPSAKAASKGETQNEGEDYDV